MARQKVAVQVNQFIGGINTESNPLNFPPNVSIDEENMELERDGSRRRRNGFDYENLAVEVSTGLVPQAGMTMARRQFRWESPGDQTGKQFLVVQLGNYIGVHDIDIVPASEGLIYSTTFDSLRYNTPFGFASLGGRLIIATGDKSLTVLSYSNGVITSSSGELSVRDFWGVEDIIGGIDFRSSDYLQVRPVTLSQPHTYNLRNQGFATPRLDGGGDVTNTIDPISNFSYASGYSSFPSNADNVSQFILPNAELATDRTADRFNAFSMWRNPPYNTKAPEGYFIIKALDRGASRLTQITNLYLNNNMLHYPVTTLPVDSTPNGAIAVAGYAGRAWYAGFSGEVTGGDSYSPSLTSYVLFSQIGNGLTDLFKCYQSADPTSHIDSDIVDTDGGFLKIDGAYGIKALVPVGASLFVFAENGVWRIVGGDENAFTATNYTVSKIFSYGCVSASSVVTDGSVISYWGDKAIYLAQKDKYGSWGVSDISQTTIQTIFEEITSSEKDSCSGYYDESTSSIRWVYGHTDSDKDSKEIILNNTHGAFTKNRVSCGTGGYGVLSISGGQPASSESSPVVTVLGVDVQSGGEDVYISLSNVSRESSQSFYCIQTASVPVIKYTFGGYRRDDSPSDWITPTGGIDTPAYLITGSATGGDARLRKNTPYITTHFKQTEEYEDSLSSCILSSQWNWTSSSLSNKWSTPRQAYRPSSHVSGATILSTRNKVRGFGKAIAFKFASEEGKFMHMYGWEFNLEATSDE
jgi:hypothetical protein